MRLTQREQAVCDELGKRQSALLADLRLHVETPTGGGVESAALRETRERFRVRLEALGARATELPGSARPDWLWSGGSGVAGSTRDASASAPPPTLVCDRLLSGASGAAGGDRGGGGAARLLLAGHLDTVHDPAGPFRELRIAADGATATGPGCVDMKGGLVIAMAALEALEACGVRLAWTFLFNSDEETGSYHSEVALREQARRHDFGLALEPAMAKGELAVSRGGSGQFMIEAFGKSAHVGRDFASGRSAVVALARAIDRAAALSDVPRGTCVNIGPLQGGNATNVVPDQARAWGNVRFAGKGEAEALAAKFDALAGSDAGGSEAGGLPRVVVHRSFNRPAKPLTDATRALAERARGAAEDLGQSLPFGSTAGVCDGNILQDEGLPTIDTLGVRGGGLHTHEEWIDLSSLLDRARLLAVLMMRLGGGGGASG